MALAAQQGDSFLIVNEPAGTYGPYYLLGGVYSLWMIQTSTGGVVANTIGPDGSTVKPLATALAAAGSSFTSPLYLPAGQYNVVVSGAASAWVALSPVPQNRT
jgi:hypothetical protein